jgi:polyhydroxyalkanoate synthesis regulator phasin
MNLDEINHRLGNIATSGDQAFANAAQYVQQMIQQVQSGGMSPAECSEMLRDVQRQMDIIQDEQQLALKEELHTIINGVIALAGAV